MLHDGLDMISMKMPEKNHLEEAVHDGFDSLVESLSDRDELGSIIHDGLHDLSEQIGSKSDVSQVLSINYSCLTIFVGVNALLGTAYGQQNFPRCFTTVSMGSKMRL